MTRLLWYREDSFLLRRSWYFKGISTDELGPNGISKTVKEVRRGQMVSGSTRIREDVKGSTKLMKSVLRRMIGQRSFFIFGIL